MLGKREKREKREKRRERRTTVGLEIDSLGGTTKPAAASSVAEETYTYGKYITVRGTVVQIDIASIKLDVDSIKFEEYLHVVSVYTESAEYVKRSTSDMVKELKLDNQLQVKNFIELFYQALGIQEVPANSTAPTLLESSRPRPH